MIGAGDWMACITMWGVISLTDRPACFLKVTRQYAGPPAWGFVVVLGLN